MYTFPLVYISNTFLRILADPKNQLWSSDFLFTSVVLSPMPPPLWESPFCPYTPHLSDFSREILIFFYFLVLFCSHHHYIIIIIIIIIINAVRKKEKYLNLINKMSRNYRCVRFVNLFMSSLGIFSVECFSFFDMMNDIGIDKKQQRYIIKKMINIAIRATYYIFCCRNRNWDSPDLMQF